MAATVARAQAITRCLGLARRLPAVALLAVCAIGTALRFANFAAVPTTPYYDAAVRSMGLSWHGFLYGALDPSGRVSIDKMPIDLWLQVASAKLLGFSSVSLRLPPAIAGALAIVLLYGVVRRGYGAWTGVAAAAAFAVLPVSVLTSRSDTMDTVMACLLVLAAWLIVRARPERRARGVVAAGAVAGLAFEVKLFEGAVSLPALAVLAWLALEPPAARRLRTLALAGLAFLAVAASWPVVASALPGHHPFPEGSTNGQIWDVVLVYNGLHRVGNAPLPATAQGILRLFRTAGPREFGQLLGVELLPALVIGALAAVCAHMLQHGVYAPAQERVGSPDGREPEPLQQQRATSMERRTSSGRHDLGHDLKVTRPEVGSSRARCGAHKPRRPPGGAQLLSEGLACGGLRRSRRGRRRDALGAADPARLLLPGAVSPTTVAGDAASTREATRLSARCPCAAG